LEERIGFPTQPIRRARAEPALRALPREQRDLEVLAHRHRGKRRRDLERAAHSAACDRAWRQAVDALATERNGTFIRRELAVAEVEARRLACSIWSDQRDELTRADAKRDALYGIDATECLRQSVHFEHGWRHAAPPARAHRRLNAPPIPVGNAMTSTR